MRKRRILSALTAMLCVMPLLAGCGSKNAAEKETKSGHEAIVIQSPYRSVSAFMDVVHKKYPEINFEVIPYSGQNYTAYVRAQLDSGDMPDIYCTTFYQPDYQDVSDKLLDLSGYDFTDNYVKARLTDVSDNGAIYMLPTYYDCIGITYNKTLLEKHGWKLPKSFQELEELAASVKEAGCNLALNELQFPGYGFQYLCNILDAGFLNTPDGRQWQKDFLDGKTTVSDSPQMLEALSALDKWKELGMLNNNGYDNKDVDTKELMAEGNTLFLFGSTNTFTEDETTDEFGLMPFLSEDGTHNAYVLNVSRYIGLNKKLEEKGNEQKLEDALHVLEVLSTEEGMRALNSNFANTSLMPLKDYTVNSEGYYADIEQDLNDGMTAPFIYGGWENIIVPVGNTMISYIKGEATLEDVVRSFDENQKLLGDDAAESYGVVTEKLDTDTCAKLVGICFAQASGADLALISKNKWYKLYDEDLNLEGVSGALYPLPLTDERITSILPTGWNSNIMTVTLSGKRIKELVKEGYDPNENGKTFPYELVTPEKFELKDDQIYTVAIAGVTDEVAEEGNLTDTGILGLDAAHTYLSQFETLSKKEIVWE